MFLSKQFKAWQRTGVIVFLKNLCQCLYMMFYLWVEEEKEKRHVCLVLPKFVVYIRSVRYLEFYPTSSLGTIPRAPLEDITAVTPYWSSHVNHHTLKSFHPFSAKNLACYSRSFFVLPYPYLILFSYSFWQSHASLPENHYYRNTEIMNRTELWELLC